MAPDAMVMVWSPWTVVEGTKKLMVLPLTMVNAVALTPSRCRSEAWTEVDRIFRLNVTVMVGGAKLRNALLGGVGAVTSNGARSSVLPVTLRTYSPWVEAAVDDRTSTKYRPG